MYVRKIEISWETVANPKPSISPTMECDVDIQKPAESNAAKTPITTN